jgi:hypothetical protein
VSSTVVFLAPFEVRFFLRKMGCQARTPGANVVPTAHPDHPVELESRTGPELVR